MRRLLLLVMMMAAATTAAGQTVAVPGTRSVERTRAAFHIGRHAATPSLGRAAVAKRTRAMPAVGDTVSFNTAGLLSEAWKPLDFRLEAAAPGVHLWVSLADIDNGNVAPADVAALMDALTLATPPGSINPGAGSLDNNLALFGPVPNVDGDGVLDVLWFDIFDDFPAGPPLLGFVAPEDYTDAPAPGEGNAADVLYLDTDPLLVGTAFGLGPEDAAAMAAALHQLLIHYNHDPDELLFVARGLFGMAQVINGYEGPGSGYLAEPIEHNIPLLAFDGFLGDNERAALFTNYLADQFGLDITGTLTREPAGGADGYEAALAAHTATRSLAEIVLDFHTANLVNDPALDPAWGYTTPGRQDVAAGPTRHFEGDLVDHTAARTVPLQPGAVQYLAWENTRDLTLTLAPATDGPVQFRAVTEAEDGTRTVRDLVPEAGTHLLEGPFARVTLLIAHTDVRAAAVAVTYAATWTPLGNVQNVVYDDGQIDGDLLLLDAAWRQAVRFAVPTGAMLGVVSLAPVFLNQVSGTGLALDAPRDLTLHVWADDGTGLPGTELYAAEITDPRPFFLTDFSLDFFTVDLTDEPALATLPALIHIGFSNAGTDANVLFGAYSAYTTEDVTALYGPIGSVTAWYRLWSLAAGTVSFSGKVAPVRAQFLLDAGPTARAAAPPPLPAALTLAAPFPNPTATTTTLGFTLPRPTPARLRVYDLLGREIATLLDAPLPAGAHTLPLDPAPWAAGTYLLVLETPTARATRLLFVMR